MFLMTLNGGIKCTDVSAILPSSCHPEEGSIAETSVHFIPPFSVIKKH